MGAHSHGVPPIGGRALPIAQGTAEAQRTPSTAACMPVAVFILASTGAGQAATVVVFEAAPNTATIFPEHPHVEGGVAIELEVQGAPPAQATRTGKRLPAAGQGPIPRNGDLQRSPGGPAAAAVCLEPEAAPGAGRQITYEEMGELEPGAGWVR